MTTKRWNNPFWRDCYTAALTGLTIAASMRSEALGAAPDGESEGAHDALAVREEEDGQDDAGEVIAAAFGYRMLLVREAIAIADTSLNVIIGEAHDKEGFKPTVPQRPAVTEVGRVVPQKTT